MKTSLTIISLMLLTACTSDQVTATLEFAVDAAITAADIAAPQDAQFLSLASACLNASTDELATKDTNVQKATLILAACAKVEAGAAPGLSPSSVAVVNAIAAFLTNIRTLETYEFSPSVRKFALAYANSTDARIDQKRLRRIKKKLGRIGRQKLHAPSGSPFNPSNCNSLTAFCG